MSYISSFISEHGTFNSRKQIFVKKMFRAEKSLTDSQMMHKYPTTKAGREF